MACFCNNAQTFNYFLILVIVIKRLVPDSRSHSHAQQGYYLRIFCHHSEERKNYFAFPKVSLSDPFIGNDKMNFLLSFPLAIVSSFNFQIILMDWRISYNLIADNLQILVTTKSKQKQNIIWENHLNDYGIG